MCIINQLIVKVANEYEEWAPQPVEDVLQHYLREACLFVYILFLYCLLFLCFIFFISVFNYELQVYPYQDLLGDTLPPGVDVKKLEVKKTILLNSSLFFINT